MWHSMCHVRYLLFLLLVILFFVLRIGNGCIWCVPNAEIDAIQPVFYACVGYTHVRIHVFLVHTWPHTCTCVPDTHIHVFRIHTYMCSWYTHVRIRVRVFRIHTCPHTCVPGTQMAAYLRSQYTNRGLCAAKCSDRWQRTARKVCHSPRVAWANLRYANRNRLLSSYKKASFVIWIGLFWHLRILDRLLLSYR